MWLPLMRPLLGTWPATQACALSGNQTGDPLITRLALNPLSHTRQGSSSLLCRGKDFLNFDEVKFIILWIAFLVSYIPKTFSQVAVQEIIFNHFFHLTRV